MRRNQTNCGFIPKVASYDPGKRGYRESSVQCVKFGASALSSLQSMAIPTAFGPPQRGVSRK